MSVEKSDLKVVLLPASGEEENEESYAIASTLGTFFFSGLRVQARATW